MPTRTQPSTTTNLNLVGCTDIPIVCGHLSSTNGGPGWHRLTIGPVTFFPDLDHLRRIRRSIDGYLAVVALEPEPEPCRRQAVTPASCPTPDVDDLLETMASTFRVPRDAAALEYDRRCHDELVEATTGGSLDGHGAAGLAIAGCEERRADR